MIPQWVENKQSKASMNVIQSIDYSILSPQDILNISTTEVKTYQLYDQMQKPKFGGPLDTRMGVGSRSLLCSTCELGIQNCIGHFGHSHLNLPIYHIGYFKNLITILKIICKKCSRILLDEPEILRSTKKLKQCQKNYFQRLILFKKLSKEAMKNRLCPHCGFTNPSIQKIPKICGKIEVKNIEMKQEITASRIRRNNQIEQIPINNQQFIYELTPWDALKILLGIRKQQYILLNVSGKTSVLDLIIQDLPIPPVTIRPSVMLTNSLSNEDDLTMKIKDIVFLNKKIEETMIQKGDQFSKINKQWYLMQSHWSQYINADSPGLPVLELKSKDIRSLINRLKGKQGRFRQNLSGKRANFTARTVISPDPNLHPTQVIVPQHMSKILTIQQTVTSQTIQMLQECIQKGSQKKGGANFILTSNNEKIMVGSYKSKIQLKYGDIVERHLRDGDVVIFNRQPSLHRISMMGFKVKIAQGKTLRFNQCVCAPFNADFDGDQMNIHVPQTLQARSQTLHLMGVSQNLMTPKSGQPIIALIQDFLTTSFLITSRDIFFNRQQFSMILAWITDADEFIDFPPPTIMKPAYLWTGKQVFSAILRPNRYARVMINLETKQQIYTKDGVRCIKDGYVLFKNSQHLLGQLGKKTLGGGNKTGLIYNLLRDNTPQVACQIMHRIAKLSSRWLSDFGMTIGLSDVTPTQNLQTVNKKTVQDAYNTYRKYLKEYQIGVMEAKPGMSIKETLQSYINETLSKVRETVGNNCIASLDRTNMPLIMALCGSKGNSVNLSQMIGCLGQQAVGGKRIPYGFTERTIPHFPRLCQTPEARGFVKNSFCSGLTASQFFFHTMGGRQGIIDTAVKSVAGKTEIIIIEDGVTKYVTIGEWVDSHLTMSNDNIQHLEKNNMEYLELTSIAYIPTVDKKGNVTWGEIKAVTRHDPGKQLYQIKTLGGREVTVTESQSLLIWHSQKKQFLPKLTPKVTLDDYVPVTMNLPYAPVLSIKIDIPSYLLKSEYLYGTDFNIAVNEMNKEIDGRQHIASEWWKHMNGKAFTLPFNSKAHLQHAITHFNTSNINPGWIYPLTNSSYHAQIPDVLELNKENGIFMGLFLAEGNSDIQSGYVQITNSDPKICQFVKDWFAKYGITCTEDIKTNDIGITSTFLRGYSNILFTLFNKLLGHDAENKHVPHEAFTAPDEFIIGILNGYFSGNATVTNNSVEASSASSRLMNGISMLCNRLGIFGKIFITKSQSNNLNNKIALSFHRITILSQWAYIFAKKVTLIHQEKNRKLQTLITSQLDCNFVSVNDVIMDKIIEINPISPDMHPKMYDLTIPSTFNFGIANGLMCRDTADTGYMQRRLIKLIQDIGVMYDYTVRTCDRKEIIQFRYGDDGLNPMKTEETADPINLKYLQNYVKSIMRLTNNHRYLNPDQILTLVPQYLEKIKQNKLIIGLNDSFLNYLFQKVTKYFQEKASKLKEDHERIQSYNLPNVIDKVYLQNCSHGISDKQLSYFFVLYTKKINKAIMQPGEAIGALTAQSIGQPATQMTLKTFHFAGISSMNITQGVPRMNQIINNAKNIATPIIEIYPIDRHNKNEAIILKNRIQKLPLGKILHSIEQVYSSSQCSLNLIINFDKIKKLKIQLTLESLKKIIDITMKTKIKKIQIANHNTLAIVPITKTNLMFQLKSLRRNIISLTIGGIKTIERALISKDKDSQFIIYAEGLGLHNILKIDGVDTNKTFSNHITEIEDVLGIEAARESIIRQIQKTMKDHAVNVNPRHINLLADFMTCKGKIIGFTRNGIDKMKDSTLMLASFEKTSDFLFDAAVQGKHDRLRGVSERIILGQTITVGTGIFDIRQDIKKKKIYGKV